MQRARNVTGAVGVRAPHVDDQGTFHRVHAHEGVHPDSAGLALGSAGGNRQHHEQRNDRLTMCVHLQSP
jgi:hypothetical protein